MRSSITSTTAAWNEAQRSATSRGFQRRDRLGGEPRRRLQPGEREVGGRPAEQRARQREAGRIALPRRRFDRRAAGIGQAEQLGGLVEGFADRVVHRRAEPDDSRRRL